MGPFVVAVAFWLFLAASAVTAIVADYKKRRAALEPLRIAIERGQQLDPAIVEKLMALEHAWAQNQATAHAIDPQALQLGGILTITTGCGVALLSFFLRPAVPIAFYPTLGLGVCAICIGIGLLIAANAVRRNRALGSSGAEPRYTGVQPASGARS